MPIDILAKGPAHRVETAESETERYTQKSQASIHANLCIERTMDANPDLSYYLSENAYLLAVNLHERDAQADTWDLSGVSPESWDVSVFATTAALVSSAEQAETEQDRPAGDILLEWAEYERAPTRECLHAYETITGDTAPWGTA